MRDYNNLFKSSNGVNRLNSNIVKQVDKIAIRQKLIKYSCRVSVIFSLINV